MTQNLWRAIILIRLVKKGISPRQALVKFTLPNKGQAEVREQFHSITALQGDGRMPNVITSMKCSYVINGANCISFRGEMAGKEHSRGRNVFGRRTFDGVWTADGVRGKTSSISSLHVKLNSSLFHPWDNDAWLNQINKVKELRSPHSDAPRGSRFCTAALGNPAVPGCVKSHTEDPGGVKSTDPVSLIFASYDTVLTWPDNPAASARQLGRAGPMYRGGNRWEEAISLGEMWNQ